MKITVKVKYAVRLTSTIGNIKTVQFSILAKPEHSLGRLMKYARKRAVQEIEKEAVLDVKLIKILRLKFCYASDEQD
jgi:hypothetical protein